MAARGRFEERAGDGEKVARRERCAYGLLAEREQERGSVVAAAAAAGRAVAASLGVEGHGTWEAGRERLGGAVGAGHVADVEADVAGDVEDAGHAAAEAAAADLGGHRRESPWVAGRDESSRAAGHSGSGWGTRRIG